MQLIKLFIVVLFSSLSINAMAVEKLVFGVDLVRADDAKKTLGEKLRKQYVIQDQLLSGTYQPNTIFIQTNDNREIIQKTNTLVEAFYPPQTRKPNTLIIPIYSIQAKRAHLDSAYSFLDLTLNYFSLAAQKQALLKYVLFTGYDDTLMHVAKTLDKSAKEKSTAARLSFLLFQNGSDYLVKVRSNNKLINIPACGGAACTIKQFVELVNNSK